MYFVRFENIAVLVEQSGKLVRGGLNLSYEIFTLDKDDFKKLSKKNPFANCKRVDYFDPNKKDAIPRYIMDYILNIPEVKSVIISKERDNKIDEILS
jgi:hypothetical protein